VNTAMMTSTMFHLPCPLFLQWILRSAFGQELCWLFERLGCTGAPDSDEEHEPLVEEIDHELGRERKGEDGVRSSKVLLQ
jgi:hypothetical protein